MIITRTKAIGTVIVLIVGAAIATQLKPSDAPIGKTKQPAHPRRYTVEVTFSPEPRRENVIVNLLRNNIDELGAPPDGLHGRRGTFSKTYEGLSTDVVRLTVYQTEGFDQPDGIRCRIFDADRPEIIYDKAYRPGVGDIDCWMNRNTTSRLSRWANFR